MSVEFGFVFVIRFHVKLRWDIVEGCLEILLSIAFFLVLVEFHPHGLLEPFVSIMLNFFIIA